MKNSNKKGIIIGGIVLVALIAIFGVVFFFNKPSTSTGAKRIIIEVKNSNGDVHDYDFATDAEYLKQAMDELASNGSGFSYAGTESEYGIMVEYVNEERASFTEDGAYWALYVNGEYGQYGIDSQPVDDGVTYSIVYEAAN